MTHLLSLLQSIQQHSQQLKACLEQEKQALDDQQYDQLILISEKKQVLLEQLTDLETQRANLSPGVQFNEFIASSGNTTLIRQWNNTRGIIARCQQQNAINGRLLNRQQQVNQDLISLLSGRKRQTEQTYNAQGSQGSSTSLLGDIKA